MKKLFGLFFIFIVLTAAVTAAAFAVAPDTIEAVTVKATPTTGVGPEITVKTANRFTIENGRASPGFAISGLADDGVWIIKCGSSSYNINKYGDVHGAVLYINSAVEGENELSLTIQNAWSNPTVVYEATIDTYFTNTALPLTVDDSFLDSTVFNTTEFRPYLNVFLPPSVDVPDLTFTLEKNGVVYGGTGDSNINSYSRTVYDPRYTKLLGFELYGARTSARSLGCSLFMGVAPETGAYDVCVYDGETLYTRIENAVSYTDDAVVSNVFGSSVYENVAGATKAYIETRISGGIPSEFTAQLWKGDTLLGTGSEYRIDNMNDSEFSAVYSIPLNGGVSLQNNTNYTIKLLRSVGDVCGDVEGTLYINENNGSNIIIQSCITTCLPYANVVLYMSGADDNNQYKFELKQGGAVLSTQYAMPSGGMVDLEFKDENGDVLTLAGKTNYSVSCYNWAAYNNNWSLFSSYGFYVYETESSGESGPVPDWSGDCNFSDGKFFTNLYANNATKSRYSDLSKYSFTLTGVGGGATYTFTGNEAETKFVRENGDDEWRFFFRKALPSTLRDGYFDAAVSYDGVPITGDSSKNILYKSYPSQLSRAPEAGCYSERVGAAYHVVGAFMRGISFTPSSVTMELYKPDSLSFTPDLTIHLTPDDSAEYWDVTPQNSAGLDLNTQYNGVILLDGKPYSTISEYVVPAALLENTQTYTASVTQSAHGTLSLSAESGGFLSPVYLLAEPEEGYELKPGSVKVNGKPIYGRGFLITENSAVTAEFQPVRQESFTINFNGNIYNGEVSASKSRAAAGESVTLTCVGESGNSWRYAVTQLYFYAGNDNNGSQTDIDLDTLTFTMPKGAVYIHAVFTHQNAVSVAGTSPDGADGLGLLELGESDSYYGSFFPGDTVTLTNLFNVSQRKRIKPGSLYYTLGGGTQRHYIDDYSFEVPNTNENLYISCEAEAIPDIEADVIECEISEDDSSVALALNLSTLDVAGEYAEIEAVVGVYDENDRLIGIKTVAVNRSEYLNGEPLTVTVNGAPYKARVFLLVGESFTPLLEQPSERSFTE